MSTRPLFLRWPTVRCFMGFPLVPMVIPSVKWCSTPRLPATKVYPTLRITQQLVTLTYPHIGGCRC